MKRKSRLSDALPCAIVCYARRLTGVAMVAGGVALAITFWLLPLGLLMAFLGAALIDPDRSCVGKV